MVFFKNKRLAFSLIPCLILLLMVSLTGCMGFGGKPNNEAPNKDKVAGRAAPRGDITEPRAPTRMTQEPTLRVYMHETGRVRSMPLETYLEGVVAGEMKNDWPIQALAAQAILARTFTMELLNRKKGTFRGGADISTDIREAQAYNADAINDNVRRAVRMTRGQVALHQGRYIHAWYFSSAGGITAAAKEGLAYPGPEPRYIKVIKTPEENAVLEAERRNWRAEFSGQEIRNAVRALGKDVGNIQGISILRRGPSGRADIIRVRGTNGTADVKGAELRIRLGSEKMRSLLLNRLVVVQGGRVVMTGRGYGHGVGMSQYGAYGLAEQGRTYDFIIKRYFRDITIQRLWR